MAVPKITATQFEDQLRTGIANRDADVDTGYGPVPDVVITPVARVLEQQNDRLRQVSLLISLLNVDQFTEADLNALVYNEGLVRSPGDQATGTVVFSRSTAPTVDATVQRGFPIATSADESTGQSVTFMTSESKTMASASASSYFNISTQRYELSVAVIALVQGAAGRVGPNRIKRPLRPLVNFDTVTNPVAVTSGGVASESNADLTQRYQLSVEGRQLSTPTGVKKYVLDNFPGVTDINTVYGDNPLLTRAATDAGAVDAFVIAETTVQTSEDLTFLGIGQLMAVSLPPMITVVSVLFGATTLVPDVDYEIVFDETGVSGSTRAQDGIKVLATTAEAFIVSSSVLTITYTYNSLVRIIQVDEASEDVHVFGRDLLYRIGVEVPVVLTANITIASGFNPSTITSLAKTAILTYINALGLGDVVEASDIQAVVRAISGIDNFVITRLTRASVASGVTDIEDIGDNEYARIDSASCVITPV